MAEKGKTDSEQTRIYLSADPPPYSSPRPLNAPTVQPGPTTVVHQGATTVIHGPAIATVQPPGVSTVVVPSQMPPNATVYTCPSCNQQIVTKVEYKPSTRTHVFAILFCLTVLWPCVCVPYCVDSCKKAHHFCPNCSAYIGS